jgi:protein-L-isoaspartate(D-aspartate) O-methyltransferase
MPRYAFALLMIWSLFSRDAASAADDYREARERMVREQMEERGVRDARVLNAMRTTPRHRFVPESEAPRAYGDYPLPIGEGQTISQPYIVALMTELARPQPEDRALEVGTGSGYQAAVLSPLVKRVYTIELEPELGARAAKILRELGYPNVTTRIGDGYAGWPDEAPFDIVLVTAAPEEVPKPLLEQLAPGGRLVVPVGPSYATQELQVIEKDASGKLTTRSVSPVRFVPLRRKPHD